MHATCVMHTTSELIATFRANDDGEPSSTAGKPILNQINARQLTDVTVIVVRYYGGVNLGTGAYQRLPYSDCRRIRQMPNRDTHC